MDFIINHYDKNYEKIHVKYIFTIDPNVKIEKDMVKVNEICSMFDTLEQIKKKISAYCLKGTSPNELYIWLDDKNSPFNSKGKKSLYKRHDLLYMITDKNSVNVSSKRDLEEISNSSNVLSSWVLEWLKKDSVALEKSQLKNIKEYSDVITEIDGILSKVPEKALSKKYLTHSQIWVDINPNLKSLNLERLFNRFVLSENVSIIRYHKDDKLETKLHSPSVNERNVNNEFWGKFITESSLKTKSSNIQLKFEYLKCNVCLLLSSEGSVNIGCHSESVSNNIDECVWKQIYEKICLWIIEPLNQIITNCITKYSYDELKYRNIRTSVYFYRNINVDENVLKQFYDLFPYFSYETVIKNDDIKRKFKFTKISDYQNQSNISNISKEIVLNAGKDNIDLAEERLGKLLMISSSESKSIIKNAQNSLSKNKGESVGINVTLGNSFSISFQDEEYIKVIFNGKKFKDIYYGLSVIRAVLWLNRVQKKIDIKVKDIETDIESAIDDLDDFVDGFESDDDAVFGYNDESEDDDFFESEKMDTVPEVEEVEEEYLIPESNTDISKNIKSDTQSATQIKLPPAPKKKTSISDIEFLSPNWCMDTDNAPRNWDVNEKNKYKNIYSYRSSRIRYYDNRLYGLQLSITGEKGLSTKKYITSCSPTSFQPLAFNHAEHDEILRRLEEYEKKNKPSHGNRILEFREYRNVWYLSCECICLREMIPFRLKELLPNETCPICKKNDYTILNDEGNPGDYIVLVPQSVRVINDKDEIIQYGVFPCRRSWKQKSVEDKSSKNEKKKPKNAKVISDTYIKRISSYPLAKDKFGDITYRMHEMFGNNIELSNPIYNNYIPTKKNAEYILRVGIYDDVSKISKDSFFHVMGWFAKLDICKLKEVVIKNLYKIKQLLRTCNGSLIKQFSAENAKANNVSEYKKWLSTNKIKENDYKNVKEIYNSYLNIKDFLNDDSAVLDHKIWWSILCFPGVVWSCGLNLYIFRISVDSKTKTLYSSDYICPHNGASYYYHYNVDNEAKTAFITYRELNSTNIYEPCVGVSVESGKILRKSIKTLFDSKYVWNSVAPLRMFCGVTNKKKYIDYLRKNNYIMNPISYYDLKNILDSLNIKIYAQILSSFYEIKGIMVSDNGKSFYIPILPISLVQERDLLILEEIPCDNLGDFNESVKFYKKLSIYGSNTEPLEYTLNLETNLMNGIILESDMIVPIKESEKGNQNKYNIKESKKVIYDCSKKISVGECELYLNEFNKFWLEYDKYIINTSKNILKSDIQLTSKNWKEMIPKYSRLSNSKDKEFLNILLNEYKYNYKQREILNIGGIPEFTDNLENNKKQKDTIIFYDNKSKNKYLKNKIEQTKYEKYIPNYNINNSEIVSDISDYIKTNSGIKLAKKWQNILHRDFKYMNSDIYSWMYKISRLEYHDELKSYQDIENWNGICDKINAIVILLYTDGRFTKYIPKNSIVKFYLLFYNVQDSPDYYPIFLNKSSSNNIEKIHFNILSFDLSTEFLKLIGEREIITKVRELEGDDIDEPNKPESKPSKSSKSSKLSKSSDMKSDDLEHGISEKKSDNNEESEKKEEEKAKSEGKTANKPEKKEMKSNESSEIKYCKLSTKTSLRRRCVETKNKEENDTKSCIFNGKRCAIKK
tara:strand:- start:6732 stop:11645 length:4914 start_codon:yes stop_codon:yes gene_type:complete